MFRRKPRIGQELLDVPMGDMIQQMAFAIAEAQIKLDTNSIEVAQMMGGLKTITETIQGEEEERITFEDSRVFFGKEKMTLGDAVDVHNTSTDKRYRASIRAAHGIQIEDNEEAKLDAGADPNTVIYVPSRLSMLELGFSPTFYQFVDTIIEVKISIKYTQEGERTRNESTDSTRKTGKHARTGLLSRVFGVNAGASSNTVTTSQVNATYSQKYSYSAEGSSLLRTKLVPIPPPAILEERIRQQMEIASEQEDD